MNLFGVKSLKWRNGKGDFVASCRKYGIKPGIYIGICWSFFLGVHDFKVNGEDSFKENRQKWL